MFCTGGAERPLGSSQPVGGASSSGGARLRDMPAGLPFVQSPPHRGKDFTAAERRAWGAETRIARLVNRTVASLKGLAAGHFEWSRLWCPGSGDSKVPFVRLSDLDSLHSPRVVDLLGRIVRYWQRLEPPCASTSRDPATLLCNLGCIGYSQPGIPRGLPSGQPSRGDVVPADLARLSLPKVEPIPIVDLSPRVAAILANWEDHLLTTPPPSPAAVQAIKSYEDPLFRTRKGKLALAALMWNAGMLRFTRSKRGPPVECFTVVKKVDDVEGLILRLIFDLRRTNRYFVAPPYVGLANAGSFAYVELTNDILQGGALRGFGGDIPDFFYRLELPPGLCEFFVLGGISAQELAAHLGLAAPVPEETFVAVRVVCMGWSWAPFLAQTVAGDSLGDDACRATESGNALSQPLFRTMHHGLPMPQFYDSHGFPDPNLAISYKYLDDFGGWMILPRGSDGVDLGPCESALAAHRSRLFAQRLGCHKEQVGLPVMLGFEIVEEQTTDGTLEYSLTPRTDKCAPLFHATSALVTAGRGSAQTVSMVVGHWTWKMLVNRPLLSVFDTVYGFIRAHWGHRFEVVELWPSVRAELLAAAHLLPFCHANLSSPWSPVVYEVDAGPGRAAILRTLSDVPTLRCMAGLAERGGWLLRDVGDDRLASSVENLLRAQMPSPPVEVEEQWADPSRWTVVFVHRLQQSEHNTVTETRAAVQAIRHHVRQFSGWHTRLMILSDAGAAIGCLSKGRSSSRLCLRLCRQAAAAIVSGGLRVYFRWVSSAKNCADGPSRGSLQPGVDPGTLRKAKDDRERAVTHPEGTEEPQAEGPEEPWERTQEPLRTKTEGTEEPWERHPRTGKKKNSSPTGHSRGAGRTPGAEPKDRQEKDQKPYGAAEGPEEPRERHPRTGKNKNGCLTGRPTSVLTLSTTRPPTGGTGRPRGEPRMHPTALICDTRLPRVTL